MTHTKHLEPIGYLVKSRLDGSIISEFEADEVIELEKVTTFKLNNEVVCKMSNEELEYKYRKLQKKILITSNLTGEIVKELHYDKLNVTKRYIEVWNKNFQVGKFARNKYGYKEV